MLRFVPLLALLCAFDAHSAVDPFAHPATGEALLRSTLARPAAQLARAQVLTGRFTHSKHLSEIPQPLRVGPHARSGGVRAGGCAPKRVESERQAEAGEEPEEGAEGDVAHERVVHGRGGWLRCLHELRVGRLRGGQQPLARGQAANIGA